MGLLSRVSSRTYRIKSLVHPYKKTTKTIKKMAELARALQSQNIWFQKSQYQSAEIKLAQFKLGVVPQPAAATPEQSRKPEAAKKPENKAAKMVSDLKQDLANNASSDGELSSMMNRVLKLEQENQAIRSSLEKALERLEKQGAFKPEESKPAAVAAPAKAEAKKVDSDAESENDDDDFFASSDDEDEESKAAAEALKAKRVAEYNARKAEKAQKKGVVAAKSSITFDVKPWDDETSLDDLLVKIKEIKLDGLVWGAAQKKPLAYGIFKLQLIAVVEDDKVSTDDLVEKIEAFEDEVQSVDIAAFNKL